MDSSSTQPGRPNWWSILLLVLVGLIAFWPSVWFDFVNLDDRSYVIENELIESWSAENLAGIATESVTRNYAPLTIFSFLIDHTIWGKNPCGYHATNVLLHVLNGVLVFVLVRQLSGNTFVGWMTAALFLVHPVQIETVAWISSRKGLLSASFMLGALIVRLKRDPDGKADLWYIGLLVGALLSKALAVVIPAIVLCYDLWVRRQRFSDAFARQFIPGMLCLLLLLKTMGAQSSVLGGLRGHMELGFAQILAVDATILWKYVSMLFYPRNLCVFYDPATNGIADIALAGGLGWLVIGAAAWKVRDRWPLITWAAVTVAFLLLPVLNFYRITTLMNDRYLYLPCIAVFGVTLAGLNRLVAIRADRQPEVLGWISGGIKWGVGLTAVVIAMALTARHLPTWRNSDSLWAHAMSQQPQIPLVRIQLALTQHDSGQKREGIRTLQKTLFQCEPDDLDRERIRRMILDWSNEVNSRTANSNANVIR